MRLYGVLARMVAEEFIEAEPIFKVDGKEEYIRFTYNEGGKRIGLHSVDITRYGKARVLPVARQDIISGEEVIVIWQKEKCISPVSGDIYFEYAIVPTPILTDSIKVMELWQSQDYVLSVAIVNNKNFLLYNKSKKEARKH